MVAVMLTAFGLGFFVLHFVMTTVVDDMVHNTGLNQSASTVSALGGVVKTLGRLDYVVFGLFIGFVLGIMITGWFVGGNPIFAFIYFIVIVVAVILSTILSNTWESISSASIFGSTVSAFPITNNLLAYLPFYVAVVGILGLLVMFAKPAFEGQG